jgi:hypothetical protein
MLGSNLEAALREVCDKKPLPRTKHGLFQLFPDSEFPTKVSVFDYLLPERVRHQYPLLLGFLGFTTEGTDTPIC